MSRSSRPSLALPPEVIDRIIEPYGETEFEDLSGDFVAANMRWVHPKTLLACHMVSRTFRACALRIIYRRVFIDLYGNLERLKRLQDIIFGDTHPRSRLVSAAGFIKEIVISLSSDNDSHRALSTQNDAVIQVLQAIGNNIPIKKLCILGNAIPHTPCDWPPFTLGIRRALETLIQLPSVASLYLRDVIKLSYQLSAMNTHLHTLSIVRSSYSQDSMEPGVSSASFDEILPSLEDFTIHHCSQFPEGLQLPALRSVSARHGYLWESETSWKVIQRSSKTLTSITIHDTEGKSFLFTSIYMGIMLMRPHLPVAIDATDRPTFPTQLVLSSFPQLETFSYTYYCNYGEIFPTLTDVAFFFNTTRPAPNLRIIEFFLFVEVRAGIHYEFSSWVANHGAWAVLDNSLASGHFSGITSVYISLEVSFSEVTEEILDGTPYLLHIADTLSSDIMASFSQSKSLTIPIKVEVHAGWTL